MPTQLHRMQIEIEARVEWGNDPESIREWMHQQDTKISDRQLEKILRQALKRKAGTLTSGGLIRAALGLLLVVLAVLLFSKYLPSLLVVLDSIPFILAFFAILAMIVGVWLAFQGLNQLLDGVVRSAAIPKPLEGSDDEDETDQHRASTDEASDVAMTGESGHRQN